MRIIIIIMMMIIRIYNPVQLVALGHPLGGQWVVEHDRVEARELRLLAYTAQSLLGEDGHQLVADEDAELGGGHELRRRAEAQREGVRAWAPWGARSC